MRTVTHHPWPLRCIVVAVLVFSSAACNKDGTPFFLENPETVEIDRNAVDAVVGELFEIHASASNPAGVSANPASGVEIVEHEGTRYVFRATQIGLHRITFSAEKAESVVLNVNVTAPEVRLTSTGTPELNLAGIGALLAAESATLVAALLDSNGCAMAGSADRIEVSADGSGAVTHTTAVEDTPAEGACPAAADAQLAIALSAQLAGASTFTITDRLVPAGNATTYTAETVGLPQLTGFDARTGTFEFTPNSPNNNCTQLLPATVPNVVFTVAGSELRVAFPSIGTVPFQMPVPGVIFAPGTPRTPMANGNHRSFSFDYQLQLERRGRAIDIVGQGGGADSEWDAAQGGSRLRACFYSSRARMNYRSTW